MSMGDDCDRRGCCSRVWEISALGDRRGCCSLEWEITPQGDGRGCCSRVWEMTVRRSALLTSMGDDCYRRGCCSHDCSGDRRGFAHEYGR